MLLCAGEYNIAKYWVGKSLFTKATWTGLFIWKANVASVSMVHPITWFTTEGAVLLYFTMYPLLFSFSVNCLWCIFEIDHNIIIKCLHFSCLERPCFLYVAILDTHISLFFAHFILSLRLFFGMWLCLVYFFGNSTVPTQSQGFERAQPYDFQLTVPYLYQYANQCHVIIIQPHTYSQNNIQIVSYLWNIKLTVN